MIRGELPVEAEVVISSTTHVWVQKERNGLPNKRDGPFISPLERQKVS